MAVLVAEVKERGKRKEEREKVQEQKKKKRLELCFLSLSFFLRRY